MSNLAVSASWRVERSVHCTLRTHSSMHAKHKCHSCVIQWRRTRHSPVSKLPAAAGASIYLLQLRRRYTSKESGMLLSFAIIPVAPARFIFFALSDVFGFEFVRRAVVLSVLLTGDIFIIVGELIALPLSPFSSPPFSLGPPSSLAPSLFDVLTVLAAGTSYKDKLPV